MPSNSIESPTTSALTKLLDAQSVCRVVDQRRQPPLASLLTLRARHPTCRVPAVSRRLLLVELPCGGRLLELGYHLVRQRAVELGCRITTVGVLVLAGEGSEAVSFHAAFRSEPFDDIDVSLAPDAPRFPRCKANHVTLVVARLPDPVDPTIAQRFIDRVFPGHRWLIRPLLVVAHPEEVGRRVVLFEPRSKVSGCGEEGRCVLGHAQHCPS